MGLFEEDQFERGKLASQLTVRLDEERRQASERRCTPLGLVDSLVHRLNRLLPRDCMRLYIVLCALMGTIGLVAKPSIGMCLEDHPPARAPRIHTQALENLGRSPPGADRRVVSASLRSCSLPSSSNDALLPLCETLLLYFGAPAGFPLAP